MDRLATKVGARNVPSTAITLFVVEARYSKKLRGVQIGQQGERACSGALNSCMLSEGW